LWNLMTDEKSLFRVYGIQPWLFAGLLFLSSLLLFASCSRPAAPVLNKEFTLSVSSDGQGTVSQRVLNQMDLMGDNPKRVELTAIPADGLDFTGWSGDLQGEQNPVVVIVDRNKQVVASFMEIGGGETVVEVTSPTGRIWLDRNLGASRAATSSTDSQAYGDLYQWGRAADGHQRRNSPTTTTLSSSDQPGHGSFILAPNSPFDWRSPQNNNLWQGVNGINNPCPAGYRLPTDAEWDAERRSWSSNNAAGAFASPLRLPVAGLRDLSSGSLYSVGSFGYYWSGTVVGTGSRYLSFYSSDASVSSKRRASGLSVRCLKN